MSSGVSPTPSNSSQNQGPTIHISNQTQSDGLENPAFEMEETAPHHGHRMEAMHAQFVAECGFASDDAAATKRSLRRESGQTITSVQNTLKVPGVTHILASTSHELDGGLMEPYEELSDTGAVPMSSASYSLHPGAISPTKSTSSHWSELLNLSRKDSIGSYHSDGEEDEKFTHSSGPSGLSTAMSSRLKDLLQRFNSRTERFKERAAQPPTPSTGSPDTKSAISSLSAEPKKREHRLDSFLPIAPSPSLFDAQIEDEKRTIRTVCCTFKIPAWIMKMRFPSTIDPTSYFYVIWLFLIAIAFLYNCAAIPLRTAFVSAKYHNKFVNKTVMQRVCPGDSVYYQPFDTENATEVYTEAYTETYTEGLLPETGSPTFTTESYDTMTEGACYFKAVTVQEPKWYPGVQREDTLFYWWAMDYLCDFLYIIDIILMRMRVRFIHNGLVERDRKEIRKHYTTSREFRMDLLCLIPLDFLYFIPQIKYSSLVRIPRILKIHAFWEFYARMDTMVKNAYIVRVIRTLTYMMYLIHLETCGYYAMSAYETLGLNEWVYDGEGIAYIRCMYLATKTATSIGNNPRPQLLAEYAFMTVYWLSGVFVFAMLIGQIRDLYQQAYAAQENYRTTMDKALFHLKSLQIPKDLQKRVRTWFNYNWEHQKTLNENLLLEALPTKMKADLAIHVHFNTLSKVQLFQDCDKNLLFDLVLKLKPVLYLPMDYICRKGEVGTEMYIVMHGMVEVVGGPNNSMVFATLQTGSVFGEISLLALAGGNRRTADVRSKGYSQLFILSKKDFEEAMYEYPEANKLLRKRAKKLLAQNAKHAEKADKVEAEEIIKSRHSTPKLVRTVIQMVSPDSHIPDLLGMRRRSSYKSQNMKDDYEAVTDAFLTEEGVRAATAEILQRDQSKDEEYEDEILVIERTEHELTPEMENSPEVIPEEVPEYLEDSDDVFEPALDGKLKSDHLNIHHTLSELPAYPPSSLNSSSSTLRREVDSILESPTPSPLMSSHESTSHPVAVETVSTTSIVDTVGKSLELESVTDHDHAIVVEPDEHTGSPSQKSSDDRSSSNGNQPGDGKSVQVLLQRPFTPGSDLRSGKDVGPLKPPGHKPSIGASGHTFSTQELLEQRPLTPHTAETLPDIKNAPQLMKDVQKPVKPKIEASETDKKVLSKHIKSKDKPRKGHTTKVAPIPSENQPANETKNRGTLTVVPPIGNKKIEEGTADEKSNASDV